jgi:lipopolysaccharide export system permease protein
MVRQLAGRFRQELHERFLNPIYGLVFGMIAFAALCQPKTTRQGRGIALAGAIVAALTMRIAGFGTSGLILRNESGVTLAYAMPAIVFALAFLHAVKPEILPNLFRRPAPKERAA